MPHRELLRRAARVTGGNPRFFSVPFGLVRAAAALLERASPHPPITRAWLGVLQHDDCVDASKACKQLGIDLRPLDETLRYCLCDGTDAQGDGNDPD